MAQLHIFNPEHDIALASNLTNFTAPHAGRQLRADLCFLPALWADEGDFVLVEDTDNATRSFRRTTRGRKCQVEWVTKTQLAGLTLDAVMPWGWDAALRHQLLRYGVDTSLLPSETRIKEIRQLSHRQTSSLVLRQLQGDGIVGESVLCESIEDVEQQLTLHHRMVLKAPWSSSGRGIRFIDGELNEYHRGWLRNLLASQGGVMAEPYYEKVKDFGMEFELTDEGIRYLGLSLFHTSNGAYTGNILATEKSKRDILSRYIPVTLLDEVKEKISHVPNFNNYRGPFGVDMMIVRDNSQLMLHPCVEINLRRTMGHVALSLSPTDDDIRKVMRIDYEDNNYKLRIRKL
ncbi:MAG: hypothetical protein IJ069_11520 [Prevotella sp.]|nr:hypothetical protein [Prevotella sp.]